MSTKQNVKTENPVQQSGCIKNKVLIVVIISRAFSYENRLNFVKVGDKETLPVTLKLKKHVKFTLT